MDFVITEGRTFFVCHLKIRTYSLHDFTRCVSVWGHYSFGLLNTCFHCPSLNSFGESLSPSRRPRGGLQSLGTHTHPSTWLGLSDHSSHGVKESRFASSLRQVVRHLAQWILFLLGLLNWEDDSPKVLPASHLADHMLSGEYEQRNRQSQKSPAEIIWVPGCSRAWCQMYLWKP